MEVRLLALSPEPLRLIWVAARTCYSPHDPARLWEEAPTPEEMLSLVRKIFKHGHLSVVEHVQATYAVSGISRTCLAQYTRHRIGVSFSVQSQRHVSEASSRRGARFGAVVPPTVARDPEARAVFEEALDRIQEAYDRLLALGIPKEDARFVLPGAADTNLVTSLNLRSLYEVYRKRVVVPGAQWEIKEMVRRMARVLVEREPWLEEFFPGLTEERTSLDRPEA